MLLQGIQLLSFNSLHWCFVMLFLTNFVKTVTDVLIPLNLRLKQFDGVYMEVLYYISFTLPISFSGRNVFFGELSDLA